jgi:hypothetical protein
MHVEIAQMLIMKKTIFVFMDYPFPIKTGILRKVAVPTELNLRFPVGLHGDVTGS